MRKVVYLFTVILVSTSFFDLSGQKKKRNRSQNDEPNFTETLSEDDLMQAEYYFIEGEKFFILDQYDKALELFKEAYSSNSSSAAINYKIAQTYYALDKKEDALTYIIRASEIDPENKYYYILTADIYTSMSNFEQASQVYEKMMVNTTGTENYLYELAALYLYQNDLEKALDTYEKAKVRFGIIEEVAYQKQQIYLKLGRNEEALNEIRELVDTYPTETIYKIDLAKLLSDTGENEEAIKILQQLLEADPTNAQASVLLSEVYRKSGDKEKAMESLKVAFENPSLNFQAKLQLLGGYISQLPDAQIEDIAVELSGKITTAHPDESRGFAIAGDLHYQLGNKPEAADNYRRAVKLDNSNFSLWQNAIQLEFELSQYDSAIVHSEEALEYFPNQASLYYYNGTAHLIKKNFRKAIRSLEQGQKYAVANPNLKSVFFGQLGDAYNSVEEHDKSDQAYEEALKIKPDNDHVLNNYSYFLSLRKVKLEKAREMSAQLVERYPDNATYLDTHAWVLYMLEEYKEAHIFLERATLDKDASGTIFEHYGDVLFKLKKVDQAIEQWKKAKELGETTDLIDKKIADRKLYE